MTLPFQGRLLQKSGVKAPNGCYTMRFALYDTSSGGTALWSETYTAGDCSSGSTNGISVNDSVFSVNLGSISSISDDFFADTSTTYYLGLKVGSDSEMTPRTKLGASPASFSSTTLGGKTLAQLTLDLILSNGSTSNRTLKASQLFAGDNLILGGTTLQSTTNLQFKDQYATTAIPFSDATNTTLPGSASSLLGALNQIYTLASSTPTIDTSTLLLKASNLSDLTSASTARTNLGLGTISTQAASAVALTGGTINGTSIGATSKSTGASPP